MMGLKDEYGRYIWEQYIPTDGSKWDWHEWIPKIWNSGEELHELSHFIEKVVEQTLRERSHPDAPLLDINSEDDGSEIVIIRAAPWKHEPYEKEALMAIACLVDVLEDEGEFYESTNRNTTILGGDYSDGEPDRVVLSRGIYKIYEESIKRRSKVSNIQGVLEEYKEIMDYRSRFKNQRQDNNSL